jgi:glycosyltransferase involved in cell wall biosynthesis
VTIAAYNVEGLIGKTVSSVMAQTYPNWTCIVMDDLSTDGTADAATSAAGGDPRVVVVRNTEKKYLLRNTAEAIELANPEPEDVVIPLDGDDWLAGPEVFQRLVRAYEKDGAWMTYGSYIGSDNRVGKDCSEYPALVRSLRLYRWTRWRASHLKSFKVWLWKKINPADLTLTETQMKNFCISRLKSGFIRSWLQMRNVAYHDLVEPSGNYFRRCVDKVIMFPMLEMAGSRAVFIPEILYVYYRHRQGRGAPGEPSSTPMHSNRFIRLYIKRRSRYQAIIDR